MIEDPIIPEQNTEQLVVYGHGFCAQSRTLQRALKQFEIAHEWRDVREGPGHYQEELRQLANGHLSVPTVLFPDGKVMVEPWPSDVMNYIQGKEDTGWFSKLIRRLKGE